MFAIPSIRPPLDPDFQPASLWNRAYRALVQQSGGGSPLALALERSDGAVSVFRTAVLPSTDDLRGATRNAC